MNTLYKATLQLPGLTQSLQLCLHNPEHDLVSKYIHEHHYWEIHETALLLDSLKAGQNIIDVGANIGYYSIISADKVGNQGNVFAFEPDPDNFALLEQNISLNHMNNIHAINAGLSNNNEDSFLYLSADNQGDHRLFAETEASAKTAIKLLNGDEFFLNHPSPIHFIKIDTQGGEFQVVDGLRNTIYNNREHLSMIVEFWPWGLIQNGHNARELLALLDSFNLTIHIMDHLQGGFYSSQRAVLLEWLEDVEHNPDNQGFINLLLTPA